MNPPTSSQGTSGRESKVPGWMELRSGRIHRDIEAVTVSGPSVRGNVVPGGFDPSRVVENMEQANPKGEGGGDWIELTTGQIHAMVEGVAPIAPYLTGRIVSSGHFEVAPSELKAWAEGSSPPSGR